MSDPGGNNRAAEAPSVMGIIDRLLAFMTSPWKAGAVAVLLIVCGVMYILYIERARIADAVLHKAGERVLIDDHAFLNDAPRLLRDTRSDMVLLVEMDLADNLMTDRVGMDTDGNRWVPSTYPQQALVPASSMPMLVKFLSNEVVCTDTASAVNEDARALAAKGFQRTCLVAVPPILGVLAGGLVVAWKTAPLPAAENRAGYVMKAAAMKFATW
jgi:hypothetical protein